MTGNKGYGQFCPVAVAAEILAERWVPLVVRELLCGSVRFNEIQRGVPKMSSSLLSRRLQELEHAGILTRQPVARGKGYEYYLTAAGEELRPLVEAMGFWAQRWVRSDLVKKENLDPGLLMWDVRRRVLEEADGWVGRNVTHFEFAGVPANQRRYWLVLDPGDADLCMKDPGFEVNLTVKASVKTVAAIWLGHMTVAQAKRQELLHLEGSRNAISAFPKWFALSIFAESGRLKPAIPG
jgi:DNA-binding HxlR family transcriptional regulator